VLFVVITIIKIMISGVTKKYQGVVVFFSITCTLFLKSGGISLVDKLCLQCPQKLLLVLNNGISGNEKR